MSDDAVLSCLDRRQTGSTVQLKPCMSFLTTRAFGDSEKGGWEPVGPSGRKTMPGGFAWRQPRV